MLNYFGFGKKIEEKIPSEIKVAPRYTKFTMFTLFILFKLLYTA